MIRALSAVAVAIALTAIAMSAPALTAPAMARDVTAKEQSALKKTVRRFLGAVKRRNYAAMVSTVSPKLVAHLAKQAKLEPKAYLAAATKQTRDYFKKVKLESYAMNVDKAFKRKTSDGTPFLLIPTRSVRVVPERGRIENRFYTLALLDGGKWYLIRVVGERQGAVIRAVYPTFKEVRFPGQSINQLK